MALEGPQLAYARADEGLAENTLEKALELARRLEDLLERARAASSATTGGAASPRSTRIACAMAAGLVDELEAINRPLRHPGAS